MGFYQLTPEQQQAQTNAWGSFDPATLTSGGSLSPAMVQYLNSSQSDPTVSMQSPDGQYYFTRTFNANPDTYQPTWGQADPNAPYEYQLHKVGNGAGDDYWRYGAGNGQYLATEQPGKDWLNPLTGVLGVFGAGLGMAALGGAAAAGAGGAAGGSTAADIGAANALSDAGYGGANWGAMSGAGGGTTAMGAASGAFNPAVDSQLASSQLGITGSQAAADATIPSVTVNGTPTASWYSNLLPNGGVSNPYTSSSGPNLADALRTVGKAYGSAAQQNQQAQTPVYSSAQDQRPSTFVAPTPGFGSIASQPKKTPMLGGLNSSWNPYAVGLLGRMNG